MLTPEIETANYWRTRLGLVEHPGGCA